VWPLPFSLSLLFFFGPVSFFADHVMPFALLAYFFCSCPLPVRDRRFVMVLFQPPPISHFVEGLKASEIKGLFVLPNFVPFSPWFRDCSVSVSIAFPRWRESL